MGRHAVMFDASALAPLMAFCRKHFSMAGLSQAASVAFSILALSAAALVFLGLSCASAQDAGGGATGDATGGAGAQMAGDAPMATITVRGSASVPMTQDGAIVRLGVERRNAKASAALAAMRDDLARLAGVFAGFGVNPDLIRTESLTLAPAYSNEATPKGGWRQVADGHAATSILSVRVEDVDSIGLVIDAATSAGANRVLGVDFVSAKDPDARARALAAAVLDARKAAEKMAAAAGMRLGAAVEIVEQSGWSPAQEGAVMMRAAADADQTPVFAGQAVMEVSVHSVWIIER